MKEILIGGAIIGTMLVGFPVGCIATKEMRREIDGKANLAQAKVEARIQIEEAKADNDAAVMRAEAKVKMATAEAQSEVIRARGVSEANEIIGDSLKDNEAYLRYLWIKGLHDGSSEVIYVPTEANLPILEAGKRK